MSEYRICTRCIMDTTASDITFDDDGVCNYCSEFLDLLRTRHGGEASRDQRLGELVAAVRAHGRGKAYDCILGVSGGLDSSYALFRAKELGLRPLAVHMDNGWNSELAVNNIERLVKSLDVDLYTHVLDWESFRELQRSFLRANVVDIEMLTDNAISATLFKLARKFRAKYMLLGTNTANEGLRMPPDWNHFKMDLRNIRAIHRHHGGSKLSPRSVPLIGLAGYLGARYLHGIQVVPILDFLRYNTADAARILQQEVGWRPYEKKHYESVFTRFYQGFLLPRKFNVDKRRVHYSTLICSDELSREEALRRMEEAPYGEADQLRADREFVLKKLGVSEEEFDGYLSAPPVSHASYPSIINVVSRLSRLKKTFKAVVATARLVPTAT